LQLTQYLGSQLRVPRRIDTVDVSEGSGKQITPLLPGTEALDDSDCIRRCAVEALVGDTTRIESVLLAADHPDLDLKDDLRLSARTE
jgi:hypothetical protein